MRERIGRSSSLPSLSSPIAKDHLLHVSVVSRRKSNNPGARESRDELGAAPDGVVRNGITRSAGGINRTVGSGGRRAQLEGAKEERRGEVCKLFLHLHHTVRVGNQVSENRVNIPTYRTSRVANAMATEAKGEAKFNVQMPGRGDKHRSAQVSIRAMISHL